MATILDHLKQTGEKEWKLEDRANYLLYSTKKQVEIYSRLSRLHYKPEHEILEEAGQTILRGFGDSLNIVGLASGPSERESILIKAALKSGKRPKYFAIDKSFEMLRESGINIPVRAESYHILADLFAIDLHELREQTGNSNLITFFGYTAFNFGKTKGLSHLQRNIASGDSAVITVGTLPEDLDKLVAEYSTHDIREFGLQPFLNAGFSPKNLEFKMFFDKKDKAVKFGYVILSLPHNLENLKVSVGDYVILATSVKLPLDGKGGYMPLIAKYLKIDEVFTEPTEMTAVIQVSAKP